MTRRRAAGAAALAAATATAAPAQMMPGMAMPGHDMAHMAHPAPAAKPPPAKPPSPLRSPARARPSGHVHHAMQDDAAPTSSAPARPAAPPLPATPPPQAAAGTALPAGDAPAPAVPTDHYADRFYPPAAMARARAGMMRENGGQRFGRLLLNLAEASSARRGYRWNGEAFWGGDVNRLWLKSEGDGGFGRALDHGEAQALYARAIGPYFDVQAGLRQDFGAGARRTYATLAVEGLAPLRFETEAALFLSTHGALLGRLEAWYDQRITQRLVLQPRAELNLAAQDVPAARIGAGLVDAELGLRLRYEIRREFAPYLGVAWERKAGATARLARAAGERGMPVSLVGGIRFWF